ncbi:hypothetical protein BC941DRAFT_465032 [Chlamydoabsidia padenii]|nr:hypothetical protein BC941DRAFT_465032 [Chlamydoabsidia padenii]
MPPHGRTIWYKALIGKIPLQHLLAKYHPPQSSMCTLCNQPEDVSHFLYACPSKKTVWNQVLNNQSIDAFSHQVDPAEFLLHLRPHTLIKQHPNLLITRGYTISKIWTHH